MNKAELIDVLAQKMGTDRPQATAALENILDTIVREVHRGESVTITGFGVFEQRRRAARVARNPRTGETVKVKTSVPAFRPGGQFKAVVSGAQRLPAEGPAVRRGVGGDGAGKPAAATWSLQPGDARAREQIHGQYGGNPQAGISRSSSTPNVLVYSDHDKAAANSYNFDGWDTAKQLFYYTGEGKTGNQLMQRGNKLIADAPQTATHSGYS
jgi:DNA-binding protein HU-beta